MIRLEGLRVQAGDFGLAIDDLTIETGEYLAVLGPTAAGKTVLLETVAGLRRPHEGRIRLGDIDMTDEPPERRNTGLVYQDYALFPHLTVAQNIAFGCRGARGRPCAPADEATQRGEARKVDPAGSSGGMDQVRELAALLGIDGLLQRYPEGLSGGEQQRVALARALAIRPAVLLLDEPLSALDGPTRLELRAELKRLHEKLGATVVHVTHDLDEALILGERIAVLIDGKCRQIGEPGEVSRFPADAEVARLVGAANIFPTAGITGEEEGRGTGVKRVRLENGLEIRTYSGEPATSAGPTYAVIRADEVTLEPMDSDRMGELVNHLVGDVSAIQMRSSHVCAEVTVSPHGARAFDAPRSSRGLVVFKAHILRPELEAKGLGLGTWVRMLIPFGAVHVCPGAGDGDGGRT